MHSWRERGEAAGARVAQARAARLLEHDHHVAEVVRAVLAIVAGLLLLDSPENVRLPLTAGVMSFSIYAGVLLWGAGQKGSRWEAHMPWLDALWFIALMALAGEAGVHYFLFLFFPVLFASWRQGLGESVLLAAFGSCAAMVVLLLRLPGLPLPVLLALPVALMVTGPLVAVLARAEAGVRRAYEFAAYLVDSIDPRPGLRSLLPTLIERIALEYKAGGALLVMRSFEDEARVLCWEAAEGCDELPAAVGGPLVEQLATLPSDLAFAWQGRRHWWRGERSAMLALAGELEAAPAELQPQIRQLAALLGEPAILCVPLVFRGIGSLRLVLTGTCGNLPVSSLRMLVHLADQLAPSLENALLLERLSSEAADGERARIGRDLHDSAVQPYIGLKFAVEALVREAGPENPVHDSLLRLQEMVTGELASMRQVVSGLRGAPGQAGALLAGAVQRQAERFSQLFGIAVEVAIDGKLPVDRRVAGELFHLVAEGLANLRRHAQARRASISLSSEEGVLILRVRDQREEAGEVRSFVPRSISERAAALGGSTRVEADALGSTVIVSIPLE
ncbi:sensor histidine kinase [Uliginosibacterium aquaticum]|uniref:histidine kinase n=1 Tax=Uliginosibacterium aquaticum TaxID=2731212 RepID=A0ABX2IEB7_9RHOO|nr:histidine kinase [Uliginosibacterium aquaticum]NSL54722.1 hypothetical protein [Uliginosibacterium aquaticum]